MRKETLGPWAAALLCAWFLAAGLVLIPYPGVQNDEALFAYGIYEPRVFEHHISVFKKIVPTMLMTYIGAVKAWLYAGIFSIWEPSVYSLRVPVLLIGAAAVWLSFLFMRRTVGLAAALAATALVATDPTYLLTTTFDWGPVAIQHLALAAGALMLVRFHQSGGWWNLALGFFALGLGLWDKALFIWVLAGLGGAAAAVFARQVWRHVTVRNIAIAVAAFALGAAPLIRYNAGRGFKTFNQNTRYSTVELDRKVAVLRASLDGHSLLGYLTPDRVSDPPGEPRNLVERGSVRLSEATGGQWRGYGTWALIGSVVLLPFAGRLRRAALFALVFSVIGWLLMVLNTGTGGGAHHIVLLWPFPQMLVAAALVGATGRLRRPGMWVAAALIAWVAAFNVLVLNQHLFGWIRGGTSTLWTDAIFPLSRQLDAEPGRNVYVLDWGILDALRLLNEGRLKLYVGSDALIDDDITEGDRAFLRHVFADPHATFIGHTPDKAVFTGVPARFDASLREAGYRKDAVRVIRDRAGRPVFEIFQVAAAAPGT